MNYQLVFDKAINHWKAGKLSDKELICYFTGAFNAFSVATPDNSVVKQCLGRFFGLSASLDAQLKTLKASSGVPSSREWIKYLPVNDVKNIITLKRDVVDNRNGNYLIKLKNESSFTIEKSGIAEFIGYNKWGETLEKLGILGLVIEATQTNSTYYDIIKRIVAIHRVVDGKDESIGDISLINQCYKG